MSHVFLQRPIFDYEAFGSVVTGSGFVSILPHTSLQASSHGDAYGQLRSISKCIDAVVTLGRNRICLKHLAIGSSFSSASVRCVTSMPPPLPVVKAYCCLTDSGSKSMQPLSQKQHPAIKPFLFIGKIVAAPSATVYIRKDDEGVVSDLAIFADSTE